jgi:ketosteroid isomerase-like protein
MQLRLLVVLALNVVAVLAITTPAFSNDQAGPSRAELTEQVRATEIAFAKTLADRDVKTFTSMIAPDVIWLADVPLRGPAAVLTRWQKFFDAPKPPFSWAPEIVEVQEGGKLALSTGPVFSPEGKRVATYTSIWRREESGKWLIIFDRGSQDCDCAAEKPKN